MMRSGQADAPPVPRRALPALALLAAAALLASPVRAAPVETPVGRWLAEDIGGGGVIDRLQSVIEIAADGRLSGSGGCNRIMGTARIGAASLSFGPIAATRMACAPTAMDQEAKFLAALERVRGWRIDAASGKLLLLDAAGTAIMTLARHPG